MLFSTFRPLVRSVPKQVQFYRTTLPLCSRVTQPETSPVTAPWHIPRVLHMTNISLAVLTPVSFILSPSLLNVPVDVALSVVLPIHTALGVQNVIEDYAPRSIQTLSTILLYFACGFSGVGLVMTSVKGPGLTETVKELWRSSKKE